MDKVQIGLKKAYRGWGIYGYLYDREGNIERKSCEMDFVPPASIFKMMKKKWMEEKFPVVIFEENTVCYMGFGTEQGAFMILGPVVFRDISGKEVREFCQRQGIWNPKGKIPYVPLKYMLSCLSTVYYLSTDTYIDEGELESHIMNIEENGETNIIIRELTWDDEEIEPYGYDKERDYKMTVASGKMNVDKSVLLHGISEIDRIGLQAVHPTKKRYEYMVLIAIIYAGEACLEAGVPYYKRQEMQEHYMKKLAECKSEIEILQIYAEAVNKFSKMSGKSKERIGGGYVERCKNYIGRNIRKKLTVDSIAQALNVSENYLSRKFSEEEGITLKRYLLKERIRLAENLLKNTDENVGTISDYLNFHSQSYFTKVFKEMHGITPAEYQKENHIKK